MATANAPTSASFTQSSAPANTPRPVIVNGEHFNFDRNADGTTHLTHGERYSGALVALTKPFLNKERNQAGHEGFNRVLKRRVESVRDAR